MIKSVSYDQSEIIKGILTLHSKNGVIDCDPTFSKGMFYKDTGIKIPTYCYDIKPLFPFVEQADCRELPLDKDSISCMIFDPPFLATTGRSLSGNENNNIMTKRFGVYPNEKALHNFYAESLKEAYRVLEKDGILIFKCQDKVSSNRQYMSHCFIYNQAVETGFYPEDLFILLSDHRLTADWQVKSQKNARKFHCYFWVFRKCGKHINYL